jgi:hypothetical protein
MTVPVQILSTTMTTTGISAAIRIIAPHTDVKIVRIIEMPPLPEITLTAFESRRIVPDEQPVLLPTTIVCLSIG